MTAAIKVENLGKKYRIGQKNSAAYATLREAIGQHTLSLIKRTRHPRPHLDKTAETEAFWALRDINFEIEQGERVGIIGRNGAGKSTLLKILSRITAPTVGKAVIHGRVASLLEVGTGFHPELTGRENIFLNGAILGMKKAEIRNKFDEIVAFAEIEKFLDTPVKRYSSGMYVRLAFAVAAHLEPEILIVDEVLAVGDAQFQKKCLGKMEEAGTEGRTVLFVSHTMGAVKALCKRAMYLNEGMIVMDDKVDKVIQYYMEGDNLESYFYQSHKFPEHPHITNICISQESESKRNFEIDKPIKITFELDSRNNSDLEIGITISNSWGVCVHHSSSAFANADDNFSNRLKRNCIIPAYGLAPGKYWVNFSLFKRNYQLYEKKEKILSIEVIFTGTLSDKTSASDWKGTCGPGLLVWE